MGLVGLGAWGLGVWGLGCRMVWDLGFGGCQVWGFMTRHTTRGFDVGSRCEEDLCAEAPASLLPGCSNFSAASRFRAWGLGPRVT